MSRDLWRPLLRTALTPMAWGTTYLVATEFLPDGRPLFAATARALPVGLVFLLWTRRLPTGGWWWRSGVLGILNIGAFFALLFVAAFRLPGGVAATAGALQPLVAAGLAALLIGERMTTRVVIAGGLGVVGVAMLVLGPDAALDPIGVGAAIAGTVSMAAGVVLTKRWGRPVDLVSFTGWQLTVGGLALLPVAVLVEGVPATWTGTNLAGLAWLAVIGTGLAYANWFRGIQQLPVAAVSFLGLLSPVVATTLGWIALDQGMSTVQIIGAGAVLAAVVLPHLSVGTAVHERFTNRSVPWRPWLPRHRVPRPSSNRANAPATSARTSLARSSTDGATPTTAAEIADSICCADTPSPRWRSTTSV
ncbi:MAG: EamA family transporter [Actinomycetota bacterium]